MRVGSEAGTGETVVLRTYGEVSDHADSVVLPLLLPDAPVVVGGRWTPPTRLPGTRWARSPSAGITDLYAVERPLELLESRMRNYAPGDTDLAWTRLTPLAFDAGGGPGPGAGRG